MRFVYVSSSTSNSIIQVQSNMLVGYGHDDAEDEFNRRWWLLHIRPYTPLDLSKLSNMKRTFTLHWKDSLNSSTDWQTFPNLSVIKRKLDWTPGYYVTTEWKDPKTGREGRADVNTKTDGSEITADEMDDFLRVRTAISSECECADWYAP